MKTSQNLIQKIWRLDSNTHSSHNTITTWPFGDYFSLIHIGSILSIHFGLKRLRDTSIESRSSNINSGISILDQWLNLSSISNFISWWWICTGFCPYRWPYSFSNYCVLLASRYETCIEWEQDFVQTLPYYLLLIIILCYLPWHEFDTGLVWQTISCLFICWTMVLIDDCLRQWCWS